MLRVCTLDELDVEVPYDVARDITRYKRNARDSGSI